MAEHCLDCKMPLSLERAKDWEVCSECFEIRLDKWLSADQNKQGQ